MSMYRVKDGRVFDTDKAVEMYDEGCYYDERSNAISLATGEQCNHQRLLKSAKGQWYIHNWSQYSGSREYITLITPDQAREWLIKNEYFNLPEGFEPIEVE